jgi:hypothetical protein
LDKCAGIRKAPDDDARNRRGPQGVVFEVLHGLSVNASCFSVSLRAGHYRSSGIHLRLRAQVLGLHVVQLLLGDEAGPRGGRLLQAHVLRMDGGAHCFSALEFVLRAKDLFLALLELERTLFKLSP